MRDWNLPCRFSERRDGGHFSSRQTAKRLSPVPDHLKGGNLRVSDDPGVEGHRSTQRQFRAAQASGEVEQVYSALAKALNSQNPTGGLHSEAVGVSYRSVEN